MQGDPDKEYYFSRNTWHLPEWPRYKYSQRPVTNMTTLPGGSEMKEGELYLPIIRYSSLYHSAENRQESDCGLFYFYEPESSSLLHLGVTALFGSKPHAYTIFAVELLRRGIESINGMPVVDYNTFDDYGQGIYNIYYQKMRQLPPWRYARHQSGDATKQWLEFRQQDIGKKDYFVEHSMIPFYENIINDPYNVHKIYHMDTSSLYPSDKSLNWHYSGLKAGNFDDIDQNICLFGRSLGLDTIIFQHEIGEYRSVTEILDTREDSYDHIVRLGEGIRKSWFNNQDEVDEEDPLFKYNTIWFKDYGFIIEQDNQLEKLYDFFVDKNDINKVKF